MSRPLALPQEPQHEEPCDGCGSYAVPCPCDISDRVFTEHGDLLDALEALEARLERGLPIEHDDELRCRVRRLLAGAYRHG